MIPWLSSFSFHLTLSHIDQRGTLCDINLCHLEFASPITDHGDLRIKVSDIKEIGINMGFG